MSNKMIIKAEGNVLTLERIFDAPRELVFKVFSEAEHLKHWWAPRGWTLTVCNVDFRPGGVWHYCMKCIDEKLVDYFGFESWSKAVYEEIIKPEKVIFVDYFSDADGNETEGMPSSQITMTFIELEGKTKIISRAQYASVEALKSAMDMGMEQGITETWDRLEEHLLSLQ
jgi:uncharacterized protein YndB with AHSA1/START domain